MTKTTYIVATIAVEGLLGMNSCNQCFRLTMTQEVIIPPGGRDVVNVHYQSPPDSDSYAVNSGLVESSSRAAE